MRNRRFVTVFPECEPVHLKKDVGMLPYSLGKYCGYDYSIVCYGSSLFNEQDIEKFNIKTIVKKNSDISDFSKYIYKHAKEIDVLNLYHISSRRNAIWIYLYKLRNPNGKVYLKLDADYRMLDLVDINPKSLKGKMKMRILRNKVDLYTVESEIMRQKIEKAWKLKTRIIPNGIFRDTEISPALANEKQDYFLTVGRLGTEQKATEDLLMAFQKIKNKTTWKLILAGSIERDFEKYIDNYFLDNPDLVDRVVFTGNISSFEELTKLYKSASVFVLPSKWESFALVLMEALECGDYLIVSDQVPSAEDIGNKGKYASVVKYGDIEDLAMEMLESTQRVFSDEYLEETYQWIHSNYTWKPIVEQLDTYIQELN